MVNTWRVLQQAFLFSSKKSKLVNRPCKYFTTSILKMEKSPFDPPPTVSGMKVLKKEFFDKKIQVPCLCIEARDIKKLMKNLKNQCLKLPNLKPTQTIDELQRHVEADCKRKIETRFESSNSMKIVLLDPNKVKCFSDLELNIDGLNYDEKNLMYIDLIIGYDNWNADKILRSIIPSELDSVTSYSLVGHIVHLNLRKELLDYKEIIAQVLLDKVKQATTIVNKVDNIENTYRNFSMEVLGGTNEMVTRVKENHCTFEFDFSTVFWNPRLSTEHERIANKFEDGDVLYDVFAGVGPFSIPAAKKGCKVFANDLNPDSCKWLERNCSLNKVERNVSIFNKDGAEFISTVIKENLLKHPPKKGGNTHITMNLPAMATSFLPEFKGLLKFEEFDKDKIPEPLLYVYCFSKGLEDPKVLARNLTEKEIGLSLSDEILDISFVRNVAPNKEMMRVTILLNQRILCYNNDKRSMMSNDEHSVFGSEKMVKPKKNNPFKVNQVRAIKSKKKAKAFVSELKKLNEIMKQKVADVDEKFKILQESVHKAPLKEVKTPTMNKEDKTEESKKAVTDFVNNEKSEKEALNKLDNMELS